ncbi:hypothetical protein BSY16_4462 (plasmid) [Sinorhizobium sp. RAC02]|mgnify:CR=1 FL=1|nr:hypothetical protein BSY16_4462 [Sinorhizobium sp. RAC02]
MEVFELAEVSLDEIALAIEVTIDSALDLVVPLGRDVGFTAPVADEIDEGLSVVASICNQGSGRRQSFEQASTAALLEAWPGERMMHNGKPP